MKIISRALQGSLAESPTVVANFLEKLADKLGQRAERDFYHMTKMKGSVVQVWDPPYLTLEAKRNLFNIDRADVMPYFSLGACMDGLNVLLQQLFNVELVATETQGGEVWASDVYKVQGSSDLNRLVRYLLLQDFPIYAYLIYSHSLS